MIYDLRKVKKTLKNNNKILLVFITLLLVFLISILSIYLVKKYIYPLKYMSNIVNANKDNGSSIDPYLVLSIIKVESGFNEKATSGKNARGLMQVKDIAARDVSNTDLKYDLHDVDINIRMGTAYFNTLIKKYDGNYYLAICAYNAGMGNVDKWISENIISQDFDKAQFENIPFKETRNYLSKVITTYRIYKILYDKNASI